MLGNDSSKVLLTSLDINQGLVTLGEVTCEITPSTAEDAYGGWWVSVYSVNRLEAARATPKEMAEITIAKAVALTSNHNTSGWTAADIRLSRPIPVLLETNLPTIQIAGSEYSNARITRKSPAQVTIYHATGVATIAMSLLPPTLQGFFHYDSAVAASYLNAQTQNISRVTSAVTPLIPVVYRNSAAQESTPLNFKSVTNQIQVVRNDSDSGNYSAGYSHTGGSVYVHGYTRKDGTYVQGHSRRR